MADIAETTPSIFLFDLGKVVVDWDPMRLYSRFFQNKREAELFCSEVCNLAWHTEHDRGVSMAANAAPLIEQYPQYEAAIKAWRSHWLDMFDGYIEGMDELIGALQARNLPIYGLTNLPAEVASETFDAFPLIQRFEDVIVSGAEGVVKPDPKIYRIALERMGHPEPNSILFVDDRHENIAAAASLGFQTHLFETADQLTTHLVAARIL